jgi:hypothetical protein
MGDAEAQRVLLLFGRGGPFEVLLVDPGARLWADARQPRGRAFPRIALAFCSDRVSTIGGVHVYPPLRRVTLQGSAWHDLTPDFLGIFHV